MMIEVRWIETAGGPLIVVPHSKAHLWRGIDGDDYAIACDVEDFAGVVERPWGRALVLNDEPLRTAIMSTESGLAIVRWMYAPSSRALTEVAAAFVPDPARLVSRVHMTFPDEPHDIFDSGSIGTTTQRLTFEPPPHAQALATYVIKHGEYIGFVLHRFEE